MTDCGIAGRGKHFTTEGSLLSAASSVVMDRGAAGDELEDGRCFGWPSVKASTGGAAQ